MLQLDSNATIMQRSKLNKNSARTAHAQRTHIHSPTRTNRCACHARARTNTHHARTVHAPHMYAHAPHAPTRTQHAHARTHTHIILCVPRTLPAQFMYSGVVKISARRHTAPFAEVFPYQVSKAQLKRCVTIFISRMVGVLTKS